MTNKLLYFIFVFFFGAFLSSGFAVVAQTLEDYLKFDSAYSTDVSCSLSPASKTVCVKIPPTYTVVFIDSEGNTSQYNIEQSQYEKLSLPNGHIFNPSIFQFTKDLTSDSN